MSRVNPSTRPNASRPNPSGPRPSTAANPNEDQQTGIIIRKINFDEKMGKNITGIMQNHMENYLRDKTKLLNSRAAAQNLEDLKKGLIVNIYNDIKKQYGEEYDFEIVRTNSKMNYWGNNENAMFVSFGGAKSEDNTFLVMANKKNKNA